MKSQNKEFHALFLLSENCGPTRAFRAATPGGQSSPPSTPSTSQLNSKTDPTHPLRMRFEWFLFSFLDQIERISESGYLPITEDIIRVRRGTKGIPGWSDWHWFVFQALDWRNYFSVPVPYEFFVSGIKFKITDVGGDREQRQNWIDVMGVGSILL